MDTGAYGSYPVGLKRRRYNIGRYLSKKYGQRRFGLKRYNNPINQFTYRKTRIGRLTKTDFQAVKVTYNDIIGLTSAGAYEFLTSTHAYKNITDMIQASPEFTSRQTQYSFYMINGMQVKYTRRWLDPIAFGVDGTSNGFTQVTYGNGLAMLSTNFYPNLTSTTVGVSTEQADSSWDTSPYIWNVQSHYQPFPKNFTTGVNSNGLGVWNACNQIANLAGELSIYNDAASSAQASDQGDVLIFDVEVNFYMTFCNNTGA